MSRASTEVSEGRLPADIAEALGPELRDALDNATRREILRLLTADEQARTAREIVQRAGRTHHQRGGLPRRGPAAVRGN